jgi:hypothetical protein
VILVLCTAIRIIHPFSILYYQYSVEPILQRAYRDYNNLQDWQPY